MMIPEFFRRKEVILNATQLYLNKALNAIIPFILIPYYNKIFGVEQYGLLIFIQAVATLLIYITDYGFIVTATREVSVYAHDKERLSSLVSSVMVMKAILTLIVFTGLVFVVWAIGLPTNSILLYLLSFLALTLQNFMPSWFFQGIKKNFIITLSNLLSKVLLVVLIWLMISEDSSLWIVPLIDSISYFLFFIVGLILIYSSFKIKFITPGVQSIKENIKLGKDNFIVTLLSWVTTGGILILTEQFVSDTDFGYFGVFTRICYYIFAAVHQINLTAFPYISERFARSGKEGQHLFKSIALPYGVFVSGVFIGGLTLGQFFFGTFFDADFNHDLPAYLPTFYLLVTWVSMVLVNNYFGLQFFIANKKDKIYRRYYSLNVLLSVIACVILAPQFGVLGAGIAMVLGEGTMLLFLVKDYLIHRSPIESEN